jgi:putative lipoprotein (rSAM/lipoprotein system)
MSHVSKIYRVIISALLALVGFSCGGGDIGGGYGEYGTPSATYKTKGVVVSEIDESPIQGIRAEIKGNHGLIKTVYTDSNGSFLLISGISFGKKLSVELMDVDGEENGSFAEMEVVADYTNIPLTGGDGKWYMGKAELDLGKIKMKPETKDENKPENEDET